MKKIRRIILLLSLALGLTGCQIVSAKSDDSPQDETTETTVSCFDQLSPNEQYEFNWLASSATHFPGLLSEEELALSTDELIDILFSADSIGLYINIDWRGRAEDWNWQNWPTAYQQVSDDYGRVFVISTANPYEKWRYFNGFLELETREDAIPCLLEAYRHAHTNDLFGEYQMNGSEYLLMQCLEVVLSQDVYLDRMTAEEKATLYELIEGFHGADRSTISTEGAPVADQSYRFYPYYPVSDE